MQINLPEDVEQQLLAAYRSRDYERMAEQLAAAVRSGRPAVVFDRVPPDRARTAEGQNSDEWRDRLQEWSDRFPAVTHFVDTSRESIYGDSAP